MANVAKIIALNGNVKIVDKDKNAKIATLGETLAQTDMIITDKNSSAEIKLENGKTLVLGENDELHLDQSVLNAQSFGNEAVVADVNNIQQAILRGDSLNALDATAAGGTAAASGAGVSLSAASFATSGHESNVNATTRDIDANASDIAAATNVPAGNPVITTSATPNQPEVTPAPQPITPINQDQERPNITTDQPDNPSITPAPKNPTPKNTTPPPTIRANEEDASVIIAPPAQQDVNTIEFTYIKEDGTPATGIAKKGSDNKWHLVDEKGNIIENDTVENDTKPYIDPDTGKITIPNGATKDGTDVSARSISDDSTPSQNVTTKAPSVAPGKQEIESNDDGSVDIKLDLTKHGKDENEKPFDNRDINEFKIDIPNENGSTTTITIRKNEDNWIIDNPDNPDSAITITPIKDNNDNITGFDINIPRDSVLDGANVNVKATDEMGENSISTNIAKNDPSITLNPILGQNPDNNPVIGQKEIILDQSGQKLVPVSGQINNAPQNEDVEIVRVVIDPATNKESEEVIATISAKDIGKNGEFSANIPVAKLEGYNIKARLNNHTDIKSEPQAPQFDLEISAKTKEIIVPDITPQSPDTIQISVKVEITSNGDTNQNSTLINPQLEVNGAWINSSSIEKPADDNKSFIVKFQIPKTDLIADTDHIVKFKSDIKDNAGNEAKVNDGINQSNDDITSSREYSINEENTSLDITLFVDNSTSLAPNNQTASTIALNAPDQNGLKSATNATDDAKVGIKFNLSDKDGIENIKIVITIPQEDSSSQTKTFEFDQNGNAKLENGLSAGTLTKENNEYKFIPNEKLFNNEADKNISFEIIAKGAGNGELEIRKSASINVDTLPPAGSVVFDNINSGNPINKDTIISQTSPLTISGKAYLDDVSAQILGKGTLNINGTNVEVSLTKVSDGVYSFSHEITNKADLDPRNASENGVIELNAKAYDSVGNIGLVSSNPNKTVFDDRPGNIDPDSKIDKTPKNGTYVYDVEGPIVDIKVLKDNIGKNQTDILGTPENIDANAAKSAAKDSSQSTPLSNDKTPEVEFSIENDFNKVSINLNGKTYTYDVDSTKNLTQTNDSKTQNGALDIQKINTGIYKFTSSNLGEDGIKSISITASDKNNNSNTTNANIDIDTTAPTGSITFEDIGKIVQKDAADANNPVSITAKYTINDAHSPSIVQDSAKVYINGSSTPLQGASVTFDKDAKGQDIAIINIANKSSLFNSTLDNGSGTIKLSFEVVDAAGNTSIVSSSGNGAGAGSKDGVFNFDNKLPIVQITSINDDHGSITGDITSKTNSEHLTDDKTPEVKFNIKNNFESIEINISGNTYTYTKNADGTLTPTQDSKLQGAPAIEKDGTGYKFTPTYENGGNKQISIKATDGAQSDTANENIKLDTDQVATAKIENIPALTSTQGSTNIQITLTKNDNADPSISGHDDSGRLMTGGVLNIGDAIYTITDISSTGDDKFVISRTESNSNSTEIVGYIPKSSVASGEFSFNVPVKNSDLTKLPDTSGIKFTGKVIDKAGNEAYITDSINNGGKDNDNKTIEGINPTKPDTIKASITAIIDDVEGGVEKTKTQSGDITSSQNSQATTDGTRTHLTNDTTPTIEFKFTNTKDDTIRTDVKDIVLTIKDTQTNQEHKITVNENKTGIYQVEVPQISGTSLTNGRYEFKVEAKDLADRPATAATSDAYVDTSVAGTFNADDGSNTLVVSAIDPNDKNTNYNLSGKFKLTSPQDKGGDIEIKLGQQEIATGKITNGEFSLNATISKEQANALKTTQLSVSYNDVAGNKESLLATVDTSALKPNVTVALQSLTDDSDGVDGKFAIATVKVTGESDTSRITSPSISLTGTSYSAEANPTINQEGNTITYQIKIPKSALSVDINKTISLNPVSIDGNSINEETPNKNFSIGGDADTNFKFNLKTPTIQGIKNDGSNLAELKEIDSDRALQTQNNTSLLNDTTPIIHGEGTAGTLVAVYDISDQESGSQTLLGVASVGDNGKYELKLDATDALTNGSHKLVAVQATADFVKADDKTAIINEASNNSQSTHKVVVNPNEGDDTQGATLIDTNNSVTAEKIGGDYKFKATVDTDVEINSNNIKVYKHGENKEVAVSIVKSEDGKAEISFTGDKPQNGEIYDIKTIDNAGNVATASTVYNAPEPTKKSIGGIYVVESGHGANLEGLNGMQGSSGQDISARIADYIAVQLSGGNGKKYGAVSGENLFGDDKISKILEAKDTSKGASSDDLAFKSVIQKDFNSSKFNLSQQNNVENLNKKLGGEINKESGINNTSSTIATLGVLKGKITVKDGEPITSITARGSLKDGFALVVIEKSGSNGKDQAVFFDASGSTPSRYTHPKEKFDTYNSLSDKKYGWSVESQTFNLEKAINYDSQEGANNEYDIRIIFGVRNTDERGGKSEPVNSFSLSYNGGDFNKILKGGIIGTNDSPKTPTENSEQNQPAENHQEIINTGDSNDTINAKGGEASKPDIIHANAGDDEIKLNANSEIDGGSGNDTLNASAETINLSALTDDDASNSEVTNIEVIKNADAINQGELTPDNISKILGTNDKILKIVADNSDEKSNKIIVDDDGTIDVNGTNELHKIENDQDVLNSYNQDASSSLSGNDIPLQDLLTKAITQEGNEGQSSQILGEGQSAHLENLSQYLGEKEGADEDDATRFVGTNSDNQTVLVDIDNDYLSTNPQI